MHRSSFSFSFPLALALALAFALAGGGCGDTGRSPVAYSMFARGAPASFSSGGYQVTLDVAEVALGPIYFCATTAASSNLCPTAENEFAAVAAFDALSSTPTELGTVHGVTGTLRSATYDYGVNWFTRQTAPTPAPEAPRGHSAHFEGRVTSEMVSFRFLADVDVVPQLQGTRAVSGARVEADIVDSNTRLDIEVSPAGWLGAVDFDELAALNQPEVTLASDSRAYSAIVARMTTTFTPSFTWRTP